MPKVNVIIITYNRAKLLSSAITSVLNQTFQDFEIIVVDDASTDNTKEVVSSFNDKRIKYIRHEINKGEAGARNTGVMNSNCKYIAFLDDDDEWMPEKLKMQVDLLENSSPKVGGVYTGYLRVNKITGEVLDRKLPAKRGNIFYEILAENWFIVSTVLLKKECFEKVGLFDGSIPYGLDWDMWIRISREFHFECIKEPLVKYSIHEDGRLTANHGLVIRGKEAMLKKYGQLLALDRKSYSYYHLNLGVRYCYDGDTKKGREMILKAIRIYPFEIRNYFNFGLSLLGGDIFKKFKEIKEKVLAPLKRGEV